LFKEMHHFMDRFHIHYTLFGIGGRWIYFDYLKRIQYNLSKPNPFGTDKFVQFIQVFGLHRFKLHRHLVDGTVSSVWFRQVFGLLRVRFRQISMYLHFIQSKPFLFGFIVVIFAWKIQTGIQKPKIEEGKTTNNGSQNTNRK
jgi:hypothetical protein